MPFENRKDGRVVSMGASLEIFWLAAGLGRQLYARATKHLGRGWATAGSLRDGRPGRRYFCAFGY